ncbi:MAG: hypothetical protein FJZ01_02910 [Candidatus Sericytochromatia bacterium]|nr:hypothetical protein [Candidatus Tanganyikabacteria bacterium]
MPTFRTFGRAALAAAIVIGAGRTPLAWAHGYPDPGGHKWQLIREEKVRYFMPADQTTGPISKHKIKSRLLSSEIEKQNERRGEEPDEPNIQKRKDKRDGATWTENLAEGRLVVSYEKHQIDTYEITRTPILDVKRWEERPRSLVENTYRVTRKLAWIDPINGSQKDASVTTVEGPFQETEYGDWAPKKDAKFLRTEVKEEVVASDVKTRKLGSMVAAAQDFTGDTLTNSGAFAGDRGKGASAARAASAGATQKLAGAGKARSSGSALALSGSPLAALLAAARNGANLHDGAGPTWYLAAGGTELLFYPYNSAGKPVNEAINVPIDKLKAAGKAGQIFIDRIENDGGLTLVGTFKNRYLTGRDATRLIVK